MIYFHYCSVLEVIRYAPFVILRTPVDWGKCKFESLGHDFSVALGPWWRAQTENVNAKRPKGYTGTVNRASKPPAPHLQEHWRGGPILTSQGEREGVRAQGARASALSRHFSRCLGDGGAVFSRTHVPTSTRPHQRPERFSLFWIMFFCRRHRVGSFFPFGFDLELPSSSLHCAWVHVCLEDHHCSSSVRNAFH